MSVIEQLEGLRNKRADSLIALQADAANLAKAVKQVDDAVLFLRGASDDLGRIGFAPEIAFGEGGKVSVTFMLPAVVSSPDNVTANVSDSVAEILQETTAQTERAAPPIADMDASPAVTEPEYKVGRCTDEELRMVTAAVANGKTCKEISAVLNRSEIGVGMKMQAIARKDAVSLVKKADKPGSDQVPTSAVKPVQDKVKQKKRAGSIPKVSEQSLSSEDRAVNSHLDAVGYSGGWSKIKDFEVLAGLVKGKAAALVADEMGVETGDVVTRFRTLNTKVGDMGHQTRLLRILRTRAGV
tara:strand:+ start:12249 stop:13142 length:894 start_codon:yes stop_codon:yes gene_type:complete